MANKRNRRRQKLTLASLNPLTWSWPNPMPRIQRLLARGKNQRRVSATSIKDKVRKPKASDNAVSAVAPAPPRAPLFTWRRAGSLTVTLLLWLLPVGLAAAAFATPLLGVRAYDYVMQTGHFHVRDVLVDGNHRLEYDRIKELAQLEPGTHLLTTDLTTMRLRLESHPWVAKATVRKELPDRLIITLTEHMPVAYLEADGHLLLINELGEPFAPLKVGEMFELPIITGLDYNVWAKRSQSDQARSTMRHAVNLTRLYRSMGLAKRWPIAEVRVENDRRMTLLISPHGTEAVLGRGPFKQKLYRLEWVLENLRQQNKVADYVLLDVERGGTDDGRVIVRAEMAPSASELRKEARAFADKAASAANARKKNGEKQGEKSAKPAKPAHKRGAVDPALNEGLLPRMRREQRQKQLQQNKQPSGGPGEASNGGTGEE